MSVTLIRLIHENISVILKVRQYCGDHTHKLQLCLQLQGGGFWLWSLGRGFWVLSLWEPMTVMSQRSGRAAGRTAGKGICTSTAGSFGKDAVCLGTVAAEKMEVAVKVSVSTSYEGAFSRKVSSPELMPSYWWVIDISSHIQLSLFIKISLFLSPASLFACCGLEFCQTYEN